MKELTRSKVLKQFVLSVICELVRRGELSRIFSCSASRISYDGTHSPFLKIDGDVGGVHCVIPRLFVGCSRQGLEEKDKSRWFDTGFEVQYEDQNLWFLDNQWCDDVGRESQYENENNRLRLSHFKILIENTFDGLIIEASGPYEKGGRIYRLVTQDNSTTMKRYEVWRSFLDKWPMSRLKELSLDEYTTFGGEFQSFCNWVEVWTEKLGSVWGGSSYKFGIFRKDPNGKNIDDSTHGGDGTYKWYKRYGDSADNVFAYVRNVITSIAETSAAGDLQKIDDVNFGHAIKWKIAFLYQNVEKPVIVPIYNKEWLCRLTGCSAETRTSQMYKVLMDKKPNGMDVFDYYEELLARLRNADLNNVVEEDDTLDENEQSEYFDLSEFVPLFSGECSSGLYFSKTIVDRVVNALLAKPFVILTGLSGSGKTKLAQAFSEWLVPDRSQLVPVGADWTNSEHLLGYPDALQPGKYVMPDTGVLKLLLDARDNPTLPFFLILDEMNLSHVERYFADFLSAMESGEDIKLYDGETRKAGDIEIPPTLKFPKNLFIIGTMNVDETTYMFSPKVLDRAQVIEFRVSKDEMAGFLDNPTTPNLDAIAGKGAKYAEAFLKLKDNPPALDEDGKTDNKDAINEALKKFFAPLSELGAEFGYRTAGEVIRFCRYYHAAGAEITDAIDAAIVQKLLPKVHGSRRKLEDVLFAFWDASLKTAGSITLDAAIDAKNPPTDIGSICKYPLTAEKVFRMRKASIANGFASFAEA